MYGREVVQSIYIHVHAHTYIYLYIYIHTYVYIYLQSVFSDQAAVTLLDSLAHIRQLYARPDEALRIVPDLAADTYTYRHIYIDMLT
jgi:hypothetical protein